MFEPRQPGLLRYPGGKSKVARTIVTIIRTLFDSSSGISEYREPFCGGGAVGLRVVRDCPGFGSYWLNDADPAMACLWRVVAERPDSLWLILGLLEPSVGYFFDCKRLLCGIDRPEDLVNYDPVSIAAMKLACHQMSFSGLGTMAGGPIGGASQTCEYDVGSRFDPARIAKRIYEASELLARVALHPDVCTCLDFEEVVTAGGDALFYLDPPHVRTCTCLYQMSFTLEDHLRLAEVLRGEDRPWLLSYDRHEAIAGLYGGWATIRTIPISYSIAGAVRSAEWLISNRPIDPP